MRRGVLMGSGALASAMLHSLIDKEVSLAEFCSHGKPPKAAETCTTLLRKLISHRARQRR